MQHGENKQRSNHVRQQLDSFLDTHGMRPSHFTPRYLPPTKTRTGTSTAVVSALEMPENLRFAMFSLVSIVPGISMLLCAIPMFFYKIAGKEKQRIVSELAEKREERGIVIDA